MRKDTARFIQEIVGDIGLEPGEDLHTKRGTGVPTVELLILVVVVLKVNGRIEGGLLEIVAHFNELPSAVGIFFLLLRHGWKRETQTADYQQFTQNHVGVYYYLIFHKLLIICYLHFTPMESLDIHY